MQQGCHSTQVRESSRLTALGLTAPIAMGYIPLGAVFGFLFVKGGAAWWLAILASLFVFAGAAQYMMIPMIAAGLSPGSIALATLIVNLRHVFYGLSLLGRLPGGGPRRWYMAFALTDETYSVLTTLPEGTGQGQMLLVAVLNQVWWVLGSTLGALIGARAQVSVAGLDFALTALFAVLAVEQLRGRKNPLPLWSAFAAYALAHVFAEGHALVVAILLCILAGAFFRESDE